MDIGNLINGIRDLISLIVPFELPGWAYRIIWWAVVLILLYLVVAKLIESWKNIFAPIIYDSNQKRRNARRKRFAKHISSEISRLDRLEEWSDYRFAELEVEVEAEGRWRHKYLPYPFKWFRSGLRREKSLSRALELSYERLILLEGEPGAGKSVVLRHLTQKLADRASNSRSNVSLIPLYINLRGLDRIEEEEIDRELIYKFILKTLNRANDRDIEEFLEIEFARGIEEGSWLFLFDSFDEIPDILSSTEDDLTIQSYAEAIADFLHGMNQCRGVVASRYFHGPSRTGWPKFKILPLSSARQTQLIKRAELSKERESNLISNLQSSRKEIIGISSNPMFLGLVCEHIRSGNEFPQNVHIVFETFITTRFDRDRDRLLKRFGYLGEEIRLLAEKIAFCMTIPSPNLT